jgi:hypothetical protein
MSEARALYHMKEPYIIDERALYHMKEPYIIYGVMSEARVHKVARLICVCAPGSEAT